MATKPKVGQIKPSKPRFELLDASPDQFEAVRFYDDAPAAPAPEEEGRTLGGTLKDVGISALKGAIAVPEAAVGLADLVTGGYAGKLLENEGGAVGFRPKQAKAALDEGYSAPQKAAFARVQAAEGLGDTFMAAVQNPSVIGQSVVESLPLMGAGGVLARGGLALAPRLAAAPGAGIVAGAAGEGAVGAGSAAESIRQQSADGLLTGGQAGLALASGGTTALFGYLGGKVAQKLGIADVDTMLAGAATDPALRKGVVRSALEGAFAEGVLEELPQSISEQVLQNIALDRPLDEGVNQAAVLGLLSGGLMGGGANVVNSFTAPEASGLPEPAAKPPAAPPANGPLSRAANLAAVANLRQVQEEEAGMPNVPQTMAPDGRAILQQREEQARIQREAELAAQRAVQSPDDEILQSIGAQPIMAAAGLPQTASQAEEDAAAQKVIDARRAAQQAQQTPAPAAQPEPTGRFTSAQEAQDYISTQRRASSASLPRALPIENEDGSFGVATEGSQGFAVAAEQDRVRRLQAAGVQPDDVLNPKGEPFKTKASATTAAKKQGGQVVPVTGGFVVRKQQAVTDGAGAGAAPDAAASDGAGRTDAATGVRSGVPDAGRVAAKPRRAKTGGVGQSLELPFGAADAAVTQPVASADKKQTAGDAGFADEPDFANTWPKPQETELNKAGRDSMFVGVPEDELLDAVIGVTQETGFGLQSTEADVDALINGIKRNIDPATGKTPTPARLEAMRKEIEQGLFSIESTLADYQNEFGDKNTEAFRAAVLPELDDLKRRAAELSESSPKNQEQPGAQPVAESQAPAPKAGEGAVANAQAGAEPVSEESKWKTLEGQWRDAPLENLQQLARQKRTNAAAYRRKDMGDQARESEQFSRRVEAIIKERSESQAGAEPDAKPVAEKAEQTKPVVNQKTEAVSDKPMAAEKSAEPFTHSGLKVYPTRIKQQDGTVKQQWAVQTAENAEREKRGERQIGGDELVDTREQAVQRAEEMSARAERDAKSKAELEAQERQQAEKEAAERANAEDIDGFMPNATKLVRGRIVKTLSTPITNGGKTTTRKALVRERVADGAKVEQAKEGRRLMMPSGTYLGEDQISKTAMDYAEHLIAQRGAEPAGQPAQATHQDPGEKPEAATKAVVAESLQKAAKNEGMKPSEMKKWLLGEIDKALADVPGYKDFLDLAKSMGEKPEKLADRIGNQYAEDGHVTFNVPGDGRFKVAKSVRNLYRFRDSVESSPAFRDTERRTPRPVIDSVRNGSRSKEDAVTGMIEDGDFEAAKEYAEAVGIDIKAVKVPRGEMKPAWEQYLKDGTLPAAPAIARLTFPVQLDVDSLLKAFPSYRSYGMTEATLYQDGEVKIKSKSGVESLGMAQSSGGNGSFMAAYVRGELRKTDKVEEAPTKPAKPKDTGWNMAGTGYAGKRYIGRNITLDDGRELVARIYENAGAYEEIEIKIDGVSKFRGQDRYKAEEKADAWIAALTQKEPELDLKGFTRTPLGNGIFQLRDGNLMVEVRPELTGLQAVHGSAKSSPRLTEQQAVDWAANIRDESKKLEGEKPRQAAKLTRDQKAAAAAEARAKHFTPGNVVNGYGGSDEVIAYDAPKEPGGAWSVTVHRVVLKDGKFLRAGKPQDARRHSTEPEQRELERGPLVVLPYTAGAEVPYTEPRADGKPFENAPDRGSKPQAAQELGAVDIGWDTMSPEQRTQILSAPGGWSTAKGGLNAVGKGLAKRAWADIVPATRATIEGLVAKVGSGTAQPASKTPTVDAHEKVMEAVREGTATPEQFKASFESVVANKEAIVAELGTKTKAELLRDGGYFLRMRYANESKPDIVDAFYRELVGEYVLGETLSYGMGKGAYEAAVRRHVEATDADKLAQYAKDRAAAVAEAQAKREARAAALDNPQTLDDYRNLLNAHIMTGKTRKEAFLMLTPEQRVQYDELEAESTREARERRKRELKTQVRAAGQTTGGEIIATKHTRDGYDLFVVQLADRVSKEDYKTLLSSAKRMGGWYSSFRGNGAVPGFQFKDRAQAEAFKALAGGDTAAAEEQVAARRDAFEDDRSQSAVERLTAMADKLDEQAQQAMNVERKTNTARRARFASAAEDAARQQQALAKTMRNIAQAIEGGRAKFLDSVRTKTQVEMLAGAVRTAKDNELRAKYDSYGEQQKRKGQPPTAETADYAEFPSFTAFRSDLASLARQMLEVEGTKKMGAQLMKVADDVTDAYMEFAKANQLQVSQFGNKAGGLAVFASREDAERAIKRSGLVGKAIVLPVKRGENRVILSPSEAMSRGIWTGDGDKRITLSRGFGQELVDAIGRRGNKTNGLSVPWQFESASDRLKAMARIGIETPAEFRSALREFIGLQEQAKEADRVKMLERDMVGRKNDGLDFFPTPQTVADQMVEAAGIEPDMAVLEPSAGMGHIADRIREAGAEPDVIEMANDRAELLEAKGFNVLARDFMEIKPRESYTFGDVFKTADGIEGIMRGAGGMGSNRVRLVNEAGDMLGYYDRDELTGVRLRGTESGYDRIIMNPPFSDRRDAEHVRHAFELLRPGGRLVAIMGEGVFFGKDKKAQDFRDWLEEKGGTAEKLPEGSFMDPSLPVNTAVNARMVVIDKPGATGAKADDAPMFSRSAADPAETLADTLLELGQVQELFQLPKSDAQDLVQVAAAKNVKAAPVTKKQMLDNRVVAAQTLGMNMSDKPGAKFWLLRTAEGKLGMLTEIDGEVYIDVSVGGTGMGGSAIYDTAMNYTANNPGKVFIGDPNDLSKAAMSRRLENMLSAAVKYGGTDFMRPHQYQTEGRYGFAPLDWTEGDSRANIEAMVKASVAATRKTNPVATANVEFDPATQSFRDWQDQPLDAASLSEMLGFDGREQGSGSAGRTTLQRNALYRALLSGPSARRALLESVRGQQAGGGSGIGSALERAFYSRGSVAPASLTRESTQQIADAISARWANAPEIIVARDMSDYVIPQRVREHNDAAKSAGATGEPEGFIYQGKVYLIADQLRSSQDVARVLFHEALGHAGLRGAFGDELKPILRQIALVRAKDVRAKAKEYGLDMAKEADRLQAAEEVLANMAQTAPELGFVKRAIAAIRTWLRNNVALFRDIDVTDDEIIRDYILPARGFIERGREASAPRALPVFSRKIPELGIVDEATEALVQEYGEPVASIMDAERRHAAGERIFAMHEQSESLSEITSVRQIKNWAPDQLVAVHRGVFEDGASFSRADQTNTPEFRKWFGDSKVVDAQGKPLVVYHGAPDARFAKTDGVFRSTKNRLGFTQNPEGVFWFASSRRVAETYADDRRAFDYQNAEAGVIAAYIKLENPLVVDAGGQTWRDAQQRGKTSDVIEEAKAAGHDGVIIRNVRDDYSSVDKPRKGEVTTTYTVFRPEQIKSATDNVGTFDPANPDIRYSRSAVSNLSNRATDLLNDALSHPGKLSFWDKSVGSMYHIAQRYPAFRRVFNSAQNFINDVSYYATEAAEQAPKILPRLETWRDLAKSPIKAADNNAIARPILEGTLSWTRDEDGSPVRVDDIEAAGIVWRDGELRSMFNLTDDQIALYREFRAATDLSLDNMGKADLLRYAGKDLEDLRDMVMDAPDVMAAAKVMRGQLQELADADPERSKELIAMAGDLEKRAERVQNLKRDGYAPLSRFGRYTVDVVVDGERRYFSLFDTARDANKMAAKMRAEFGADAVSQGTLSQREFEAFQGITPESLELFGNMLGLDSTGDEAQDKVFQTYLRLTKANRSALKRLIHRKGVAGYSDDMGRVLAAFVYSNARQTSAALHMGEMGRAVQDIPKGQGELKDVAIELSSYIKQPREEAQALRGLLFAQYLGGSVASAFVNFTQPFTVTFPYLIRFGGARRSAQALMKAMADQRDGVKLEDGLARALKTAEEQGVVAPQEVHQLMAQARGESTLKAGDGTRAGEALAATRNAWTRTALAWGKMFGMAEQINRRSTFIAAYRIAAERGMRNPAAFATKAVNETQFVNNRANKARWARGPVGATLMTFKSYSVHYMELMHRLATREGPEGKKAAAMMLGMLLLVAGAGGLPFVEDAEDVVDMIAQRMGYNFSSKQAKRQFLEDLFGKAGAQFVEKGVTGLAGSPIDISGRMSMANLIPGTGLLLKKPDQSRDMQELVGPVGDLVKRGWKGADLALSGEFGKALLEVSPRAVANAAKGVDMANTGVYTDTRGRKVIETDLGDAVAKAIGFQPQSVAQVQDATFTVQKMVSQNKMREAEIAEKWAQGIYEGNKAKIEEARQMVRDWNRKNPKTPIKIELPQILKRVRAMRMSKEDRIAKTAPSEIRGAVQRELAAQ